MHCYLHSILNRMPAIVTIRWNKKVAQLCPKVAQKKQLMLFKIAERVTPNTRVTFVRKFVAENFQKSSNLVTLMPMLKR